MRTLALFTTATLLLVSSTATAAPPHKKAHAKKKTPVVSVAAAVETLPPLPAPDPAPAAAPQPAPSPSAAGTNARVERDEPKAASSAATVPKMTEPGFVLTISTGGGYFGGQVADDVKIGAVLTTFDVLAGAYVSRHVGIMGGLRAGYGHLTTGCDSDCADAFAYQVPVLVEYAIDDRRQGAYFEAGLGLFTNYGASASSGSDSATLHLKSSYDAKLAVGYRIATKDSKSGVDLKLGFDYGEFDSLSASTDGESVEGDIDDGKKAHHYMVGLDVGWHFTP